MGGADDPAHASESNSSGGDTIHVRCSNGSKFSVKIGLDSTIRDFKAVLSQNCDIPADHQRLIYKGRILKDDQTLESYGLEAEHTVHLVRGFAAAASADTSDVQNVGGVNTTSINGRGSGLNESGFPLEGAASLFSELGINGLGGRGGASGGLFAAGLPDFEQVQQQLTQNPNMMREIMNMPVVQNLINNPEIMRNLIMSNPQMREIMDRNPELAHILNDPSTLRQTLEATRNPELMREMMRNTDRAMSNIESSPEGFNMLRRMYETIQEPFLNATTMAAGDGGNDLGSNPFAAILGAQGGAQPRDRPTHNLPTSPETTTGSPPSPNTNPLPNPWRSAAAGGVQANTVGDDRLPVPSGLDGLQLPNLEGMLGSMQDPTLANRLLQNPGISHMMQSLLSDPQYMNQVVAINPQLRSILDSNPHLREMMQNPEFLRQLTSPETMQQFLTLQQSLVSQLSRQQWDQGPGQTGGGSGKPVLVGDCKGVSENCWGFERTSFVV